jgi:hypothetical protein
MLGPQPPTRNHEEATKPEPQSRRDGPRHNGHASAVRARAVVFFAAVKIRNRAHEILLVIQELASARRDQLSAETPKCAMDNLAPPARSGN